jgi:DNA-binding transcriptional ArsR family regulator
MTPIGTDAPTHAHHQLDERLAKALSHPLRQRILQRLNEAGIASPNELSQVLGDPLGNVS